MSLWVNDLIGRSKNFCNFFKLLHRILESLHYSYQPERIKLHFTKLQKKIYDFIEKLKNEIITGQTSKQFE